MIDKTALVTHATFTIFDIDVSVVVQGTTRRHRQSIQNQIIVEIQCSNIRDGDRSR